MMWFEEFEWTSSVLSVWFCALSVCLLAEKNVWTFSVFCFDCMRNLFSEHFFLLKYPLQSAVLFHVFFLEFSIGQMASLGQTTSKLNPRFHLSTYLTWSQNKGFELCVTQTWNRPSYQVKNLVLRRGLGFFWDSNWVAFQSNRPSQKLKEGWKWPVDSRNSLKVISRATVLFHSGRPSGILTQRTVIVMNSFVICSLRNLC